MKVPPVDRRLIVPAPWRSIRRLGLLSLVVATAALIAVPASALPLNGRSWAPPFHGKFLHSMTFSTGTCLGSRNTTTFSHPKFNLTTGTGQLNMQSNTSGSYCSSSQSRSAIHELFGFSTYGFRIGMGTHHIVLTWSLRWFASLTAVGGRNGSILPASASFGIGVNGTKLCDTVRGACAVFPNSSASGSSYTVGWSTSNTVTNSTFHQLGTAKITLYLNATFGGANPFKITSMLYAYTIAHAQHGSYKAQSLLLFNPILGGYVKLVGITIR